MSIETLNIIGDKITTSAPLKSKFSGNIDTYQLQVSFDSAWDGLVKFVKFEINGNPLEPQEVVDGIITIPHEVFVNPCECTIGFFGTNLNSVIKRISTGQTSFTVRQGAYVEGGTSPSVPTPSLWEVYLAEIKDYSDSAEQSATTATEKAQSVETTKGEIDTIKTHIDGQKVATDTNAINAKASEDNAKDSETEAERQAGIALNNILNGVTTHNEDEQSHPHILGELVAIEAIARGKATAKVFDTVTDMNDWLAIPENVEQLSIGDNLYIVDIDVPDYWWDGTQPQILEAEAVNLTDYYNKIEVDARLPIPIEQADHDILLANGADLAGRIYYVVPVGELT